MWCESSICDVVDVRTGYMYVVRCKVMEGLTFSREGRSGGDREDGWPVLTGQTPPWTDQRHILQACQREREEDKETQTQRGVSQLYTYYN